MEIIQIYLRRKNPYITKVRNIYIDFFRLILLQKKEGCVDFFKKKKKQ